ncbi:MAG: hypothetical protein H8D23_19430 [Candidatus Brocadiales bacterium]|nr:hypothetical protein [Candidatus Brocadiales bacterium]
MIIRLLDTEKTHLDDNTNKRIDSDLLGQITDNKEADLSDTQKHKNIFNTDGGLLDVEIK